MMEWVRFWLGALQGVWLWVRAWPGEAWWALAVALFALVGLRAWLLARPRLHPVSSGRSSAPPCPPGPVTRYTELLRQAELGRLLRRNLQRELARVAADRLALQENLSEEVARKRVGRGEWAAPPEVRKLLRRERTLPSLSLRERLRRALRRSRDEDFREELEKAIAFLERYEQ